ncbi:hypothetical protein COCC4DRAFT_143333 [Bipolaris maydis ATCC 48331]|uniref:Uncharacterized protein n=2 Tax=Cochliobolus heterostrophus TaxID=5016 RepID=M2U1E9_COCH5|nr:uncharacterized protein COCC4DRAFT_143333 [Bipolaris maydis ATCC 48331]EMD87841.1 hypothetical protein COCHEDRAFT_1111993 [Bipolaris maydis C5]ENI03355.1 hypothetical protein COCC4DRAFT_143333 [Bipolaris maydis ATCC 48331]KAJ6206835.1 hypothetical protein PSV09DRAFT_1111993 [Bipolaris maydis]
MVTVSDSGLHGFRNSTLTDSSSLGVNVYLNVVNSSCTHAVQMLPQFVKAFAIFDALYFAGVSILILIAYLQILVAGQHGPRAVLCKG